ncbi:putative periplasmic lipoprotein [Actinophytocola algeriensis]|uniref:Lipoprotein n=1 Tax=Actinophytocola algeriensis TaxID=1768010 RepID=A0A7W7VHE7_9PSEU|nr:hypothetical protein [Actinophytocola algeriensis]MBB4910437.1 hypothetical protein [Actinophytocola algeriensis]MBE1480574.1 hypothetical protein [Actinophytocola algeriensis]
MAVRRALRWFPLLAITLVLAGCGGPATSDEVTESEAYERVDSYVRRAATALPDVKLEEAAPAASGPCRGEPRGRVVVRNTYWIRGLVDENRHFDTMVGWWEDNGFEVVRDLRPARHYVWVENTADGFRMSLKDNDEGELLLGAESPCVATG